MVIVRDREEETSSVDYCHDLSRSKHVGVLYDTLFLTRRLSYFSERIKSVKILNVPAHIE